MPAAIPIVLTVAKVAMTVYSAVTAVKALKEGNILGAVMGGFGAYMGMSSLGAFGAGAGEVAATGAVEGAALGSAEAISEAAVGDMFSGFATEGTMAPLGEAATAATGGIDYSGVLTDLGSVTGDVGQAIGTGGFMGDLGDAFAGGLDRVTSGIQDLYGDIIQGDLLSQGDGTFLDSGTGNIFDEAGNLLKGVSGDSLLKAGQMGIGYLTKQQELEAQRDAAKEGREYMQAEQEKDRALRYTPTTFVPPSTYRK